MARFILHRGGDHCDWTVASIYLHLFSAVAHLSSRPQLAVTLAFSFSVILRNGISYFERKVVELVEQTLFQSEEASQLLRVESTGILWMLFSPFVFLTSVRLFFSFFLLSVRDR